MQYNVKNFFTMTHSNYPTPAPDDPEASLRDKQYRALHICYDRLIDALPECSNESSLAKCLETIRKDINAAQAAAQAAASPARNNSLTDTARRLEAVNNLLKDLCHD